MTVDIGQVFSDTFAMIKDRWLSMIGLWAAFLGFLVLFAIVLFGVAGSGMAVIGGALSDPSSFNSAAAAGGLGFGFLFLALIFYIGYIVILFAQQGSMVAMASPLHTLSFREAFGRGLKGGLTFLGVMLIYIVASIVLWLLMMLVAVIVSFLGEIGGIIVALGVLVGAIYLACRFSVIVPVIVVEKVYNPINAINRTWAITGGNVLRILVVLIVFAVLALIMFGLPYALLFAMVDLGSVSMGGAFSAMIVFFLFFVVMYFVFTLFSTSMLASLHAQMSDTQAVEFGKTFE